MTDALVSTLACKVYGVVSFLSELCERRGEIKDVVWTRLSLLVQMADHRGRHT